MKSLGAAERRDLSNPIPSWPEHGADRQVVPYTVATDMDSPNPDSGEGYYRTNTQLYGVLDDHNRFKLGEAGRHASRRPSLRDCMTAWLRLETPSLR